METTSPGNILAVYYQTHRTELLRFVASRMGRTDVAEDIVQTTFERLLVSGKMITPVTLPCLVYTTARNLLYDYWRHHKTVEAFEHYLIRSSSSGADSAESVYSVQEMRELLESGISRLTEKQREVYELSIYEGMKVSEISETLHISYKSAENRLGIARKQVRAFMKSRLAI